MAQHHGVLARHIADATFRVRMQIEPQMPTLSPALHLARTGIIDLLLHQAHSRGAISSAISIFTHCKVESAHDPVQLYSHAR